MSRRDVRGEETEETQGSWKKEYLEKPKRRGLMGSDLPTFEI